MHPTHRLTVSQYHTLAHRLRLRAKGLLYGVALILAGTLLTACQKEKTEPVVALETTEGTLVLQLHPDYAPKTVALFLKHVDAGFYDNILFHRVIPNFMAQTGGFTEGFLKKEPLGTVVNESIGGLPNIKGSVAMARTNDPHSASSQFYINVANNISLNADGDRFGYTVFATVIEGQDIAPNITKLPQGAHSRKGYRNAPNTPVRITSAKRLQPKPPLTFDTPLPGAIAGEAAHSAP